MRRVGRVTYVVIARLQVETAVRAAHGVEDGDEVEGGTAALLAPAHGVLMVCRHEVTMERE